MKPLARKNDLITEELPDTGEITRRLQGELSVPVDESVVRMALQQLLAARLIEADSVMPLLNPWPTRREVARKLPAGAALSIPLVTSMVVPTAARAQSRRSSDVGGDRGRGHGRGRSH